MVFIILTRHSLATLERKCLTWSLKLSVKQSLRPIKLNCNENEPNKAQILSENGDKQSQNTHVEVNIFARQKSKARSRVWIVQNNLHIVET